jgi:tRNA G18 (ribose-2'-O)-methylase SpoU
VIVETGDRDVAALQHPVAFVLDNLRSAHNVGNIFRLAEICGIERILTCGYTATPPHPKLVKTARGCDVLVPCEHKPTGVAAVEALQTDGYQVVAVETVVDAPNVWDVTYKQPVAFVFGNEAIGLAPETLERCDLAVRLPVFGRKNSLNVGNCAAVVAYTVIRQLHG